VGIHCADHATHSTREGCHWLRRQSAVARSYSSLADYGHGGFFSLCLRIIIVKCHYRNMSLDSPLSMFYRIILERFSKCLRPQWFCVSEPSSLTDLGIICNNYQTLETIATSQGSPGRKHSNTCTPSPLSVFIAISDIYSNMSHWNIFVFTPLQSERRETELPTININEN
jgi:hypothetical protein